MAADFYKYRTVKIYIQVIKSKIFKTAWVKREICVASSKMTIRLQVKEHIKKYLGSPVPQYSTHNNLDLNVCSLSIQTPSLIH